MELAAMAPAWLVALTRAATGMVFLVKPEPAAEKWIGNCDLPPRYLVRVVGARDLVA